MRVILAIEPRSYREIIGAAIKYTRPHIEVTVIEPGLLQVGIRRLDPELVFAGRPETSVPTGRCAWVEFCPYEHPPARIKLGGRRWELEKVEFDDLLSLVDETEELSRKTRELRNS